ncbi:MAG: CBS domain-containing protein [Wenzhouxiangellaceae bacterium]|nr:CBS domain-containing protein [Wenzhouxiangellaceae bacterium]
MHTIHQILKQKGNDVHWVGPDSTVFDAIRKMAELGVGALLVMREGKPVGMLSERDYARKVILEGKRSRECQVGDIMSSSLISIDGRASAEAGLALMSNKHIRHLPVIDDGKLVGMVSIGDLVNAVIADQQQLIEQLERYVTG